MPETMPQMEKAEQSPGELRIQEWIGRMAASGCTNEKIDWVLNSTVPYFLDGKQWSVEDIAIAAGEKPGLNMQSRYYAAEDRVTAACRKAANDEAFNIATEFSEDQS